VPNAAVAAYLERRRTVDRGQNQRRFEFISRQIDSVATALAAAEGALRGEQEASGVLDPELSGKAGVEALQNVRKEFVALEAERAAARRIVEQVRSGAITPRQLAAFPSLLRSPAINSVLTQISALETERTRLRERRTERDPEVAALGTSIADLERELVGLASAYAQSLERQTQSLSEQEQQVTTRLEALPRQAQGNLRLQREVRRLTQTSLGLQAQLIDARLAAISEGGQVRAVDAARPAKRVTFPRPLPTALGAALLGLLGGMIWAVVRAAASTRLRTAADVERAAGLPVALDRPGRALLLGVDLSAGTVVVAPVDAGRRRRGRGGGAPHRRAGGRPGPAHGGGGAGGPRPLVRGRHGGDGGGRERPRGRRVPGPRRQARGGCAAPGARRGAGGKGERVAGSRAGRGGRRGRAARDDVRGRRTGERGPRRRTRRAGARRSRRGRRARGRAPLTAVGTSAAPAWAPRAAGPAARLGGAARSRLGVRPIAVLRGSLVLMWLGNLGRIPLVSTETKDAPLLVNELLLLVTLAVAAVACVQARTLRVDRVIGAAAAFVAVGAGSAVAAAAEYGLSGFELTLSLAYLARWVAYAGLYVVVVNCAADDDAEPLWRTLERVVLAFAAFGVVQAIFLPGFAQLVQPQDTTALTWDRQGHRLVSTLLDPNFAGALMLLVLLVQLARVAYGDRVARWKPMLLLAGVVLTVSRSTDPGARGGVRRDRLGARAQPPAAPRRRAGRGADRAVPAAARPVRGRVQQVPRRPVGDGPHRVVAAGDHGGRRPPVLRASASTRTASCRARTAGTRSAGRATRSTAGSSS
jgi:hypothetical protein